MRLQLPDFARGPGQPVNLPANTVGGMPPTLVSDGTLFDVAFRLVVDPKSLSLNEIRRGVDLPLDAELLVTPVAGLPGSFDVRVRRAAALPAGNLKLLSLFGDVLTDAALGRVSLLELQAVTMNGTAAPAAADAAPHAVAYLGDLNLDARYDSTDVNLMGRLGSNQSFPNEV